MRRGLSEVVASLLSLVVTLGLLGAFLAFNYNYLVPTASYVETPQVQLMSVMWTYKNCVYVEVYGTSPITIAYAVVGTSTTPSPVTVCQLVPNVNGRHLIPDPTNTLLPDNLYQIQIKQIPGGQGTQVTGGQGTQVTLFTTQGTFYQVVL
ncbi:hypothetical protein MetMK1DRAFT_00000070 [Metallosphaera yellowstonensis MK1]|uniref:Archaeal flagellin-like protein n=1 Tax=Metallosphaera yellowstonensis MK1 TaxID=671065 RepID=H2C0D7_9CREN|nr:hypothetical protein [Metallosphaera yellowstonensis]EHP71336.1 hypothetical protein MetMK1DRAFT_00000070 [Metallosphaera yellowstonensis MK1]